jgi:outer membrane protein assembly factor BamB
MRNCDLAGDRSATTLRAVPRLLPCAILAAVRWRHESIAPASLLYADRRLYLHGENGEVALVAASPDGYREAGRFTPAARSPVRGDQAWVYPVVSGGRLFIREHGTLWTFDVRGRD